jgi:antitoxin MazE
MKTAVQCWGNSLALRIPKAFAGETNLHEGSEVELSLFEGGLMVKPIRSRRRSLDDLLKQVTPTNLHRETDTGDAVGKEIW